MARDTLREVGGSAIDRAPHAEQRHGTGDPGADVELGDESLGRGHVRDERGAQQQAWVRWIDRDDLDAPGPGCTLEEVRGAEGNRGFAQADRCMVLEDLARRPGELDAGALERLELGVRDVSEADARMGEQRVAIGLERHDIVGQERGAVCEQVKGERGLSGSRRRDERDRPRSHPYRARVEHLESLQRGRDRQPLADQQMPARASSRGSTENLVSTGADQALAKPDDPHAIADIPITIDREHPPAAGASQLERTLRGAARPAGPDEGGLSQGQVDVALGGMEILVTPLAGLEDSGQAEVRPQVDAEGTTGEAAWGCDVCPGDHGHRQPARGFRSLLSMGASSFGSAFGAVDLSADPDALAEYLGRVSSVPAVRAAKRESFALLCAADGHRILDLGCGDGEDVRALAPVVGPSGLVVGLDKSNVLIEQARRVTPPEQSWVEFICADANALPFADASFDACRADRTIQHLADADVALAELARVTRAGGVIVLSEMFNALDLPGDEPDPIAREVLARFWSEDERRGWIGFLLPPLLERAGLVDVQLHRRHERLTSFADTALLLQLPELCAAAVSDGALEPAAARRWLTDLERDFAAGRAGLESDFFHMKARRPQQSSATTATSSP